MLIACTASKAGPSSARMLSAHLQPHQPSTAGHAGTVALTACWDPGSEDSGPWRMFRSATWIWGAALPKGPRCRSDPHPQCARCWFLALPWLLPAPAQPARLWAPAPSAACKALKTTQRKEIQMISILLSQWRLGSRGGLERRLVETRLAF